MGDPRDPRDDAARLMSDLNEVAAEWNSHVDRAKEERRIARLITGSISATGKRWAELTPLDIARHLVANGVFLVLEVQQ
jgi:hypothetical protein